MTPVPLPMPDPITSAEGWCNLILAEVNGGDGLQAVLAALWRRHDRHRQRPYRQYLYTKRSALQYQLAHLTEVAPPAPVSGEVASIVSLDERKLRLLLDEVKSEIRHNQMGSVQMGTLAAQTIVPGPAGAPNADAPAYTTGTPYPGSPARTPWPKVPHP